MVTFNLNGYTVTKLDEDAEFGYYYRISGPGVQAEGWFDSLDCGGRDAASFIRDAEALGN